MNWIGDIDDAELRTEIRGVLARLEVLSDASAATPGRSSRSSETPIGPPGFAGLSELDCPPEDRSLYEHFRYRFEKAVRSGSSRKALYFLLWEAEKALRLRIVRPESDRQALVLNRADEDALIRRVLTDYEGQHSYRVHLDLDLPQGWIERIREQDGREPETGYRRPKWRGLDEGVKRELVRSLQESGKNQTEVARWLGVSRKTVANYSADRAA